MKIFDPNKEPFISYGKEFINYPAVIRAGMSLKPAEFKWDYWMDLDEHLKATHPTEYLI